MMIMEPITNDNITGKELIVRNCIFENLLNKTHASCIHIEKNSLDIRIDSSSFTLCVQPNQNLYFGTIYISTSSSSFLVKNTLFHSCYGSTGSAIYFNSSETVSNVEINQTTTTSCISKISTIYLAYDELASSDYNATFCLSTDRHVFVSHFNGSSYSSFFNFYRNPTTVQYCTSKPSDTNFIIHSNFIENSNQTDYYGVITTDYSESQKNICTILCIYRKFAAIIQCSQRNHSRIKYYLRCLEYIRN